jgi:hypothetical protein
MMVHVDETTIKSVLLRIVPVRLRGSKGELSTFALLDDASTVIVVDSIIAEKIGADGPEAPFCSVWTKGQSQTEKDSKNHFNLCAMCQS